MASAGKNQNGRILRERQRRKMIIFAVEGVFILVLIIVAFAVLGGFGIFGAGSGQSGNVQGSGKINITNEFDEDEVNVPQQVQEQKEDGGAMKGYRNIALFGVDAKTENQLYKSSRSDTIMIASINLDTCEIKLVSVYRDTYLNTGNDQYRKCNSAYSVGGAKDAIAMLNTNLDMDITDFVTVGYAALAEVIDGLGGVQIDVDKDELQHINNYQYSILGKYAKKYLGEVPSDLNFTPDEYFKDYDLKLVSQPGYQLLNGLQAAAYCRIRYVGNDYQRTERQREVIKAIEKRAKETDTKTLINILNSSLDDIYTNLDIDDIIALLPDIAKYSIVDESGFPRREMIDPTDMGAKGACLLPKDLVSDVEWLHEFLFDDANYQVTDTVKKISAKINADGAEYK